MEQGPGQRPSHEGAPTFGRYKLLSLLGKGGTARVYRALRPGPMGFGKEVALKIIEPDASLGDEPLVSLANEARLGCLLRHPNIVTVDEFDTVDGAFYIAMEFVEGWSLEKLIKSQRKRGAPIPLPVILQILIAICDGLDYAHTLTDRSDTPLGIVHRDLKPANVMISRRGEVKVADFGTAKAKTNVKETQAGYTRGTPAYMSPEQVTGGILDARADVFSFGALLYETVTLRMAFGGENILEVMKLVLEADISDARARVGRVAPALEPVLKRCMARDPMARYQSVATVAGDLRRLQARVGNTPTVRDWIDGLEADLRLAKTGEFGWDPVVASRAGKITGAETELPTAAAEALDEPEADRVSHSQLLGPGWSPEAETMARPAIPPALESQSLFGGGMDEFQPPAMTPDHELPVQRLPDLPRGGSVFDGVEGAPPPAPAPPPERRPPPPRLFDAPSPPPSEAPPRKPRPRPRSTPGAGPPTKSPPLRVGPRKGIAASPARTLAYRFGYFGVRALAVYVAVLFLAPGLPGETGEFMVGMRDWHVGMFTGDPVPPPWAGAKTVVVSESDLVSFEAGTVRMGEDRRAAPKIEVPAFSMMNHEVTVDEYRTGCPRAWWQWGCPGWDGATPGQTGAHPAVRVTWANAKAWCEAQGWRLPTEVEWELAARGTSGRRFPWGAEFQKASMNYCDIGCTVLDTGEDDGWAKTSPVQTFAKGKTPEDVHDLSGNASEWTLDCWIEDLAKRDSWKPVQGGACSARVVRGGSWRDTMVNQAGWRRTPGDPKLPTEKIGFRCATGADPFAVETPTP